MGPMWQPDNLAHLVAWLVALLYSVLCAAVAGWLRRPAVAPAAVPAWLMQGARWLLWLLLWVPLCKLWGLGFRVEGD
jgi:hypothetical protein